MIRTILLIALPFVVGATYASAADNNPLGWYLEGAIGHANVRSTVRIDPTYEIDESATGWKVSVGVRPVRMLAAELEYVDFGHPHSTSSVGLLESESNTLQRASALSSLVFLPIPLQLLDVYARAGVARLRSSGGNQLAYNPLLKAPSNFIIIAPSSFNRTDTDLLYGAGLQVRLPVVALRLEYERINDHYGDPDLVSLGVMWTF
jgi:opacity protein-like surface antigen